MQISPFLIYLWQLADQARGFLMVITIIAGIAAGIGAMAFDLESWAKVVTKRCGIAALCFGIAAILIPSSKTIAMMVVIPRLASSKAIQTDIPDLYNLAVDTLKQKLQAEAEHGN